MSSPSIKDSAGFAKGDYVAFEERRGEKIVVRDEQGRGFAFPPLEMEGFDVVCHGRCRQAGCVTR